MKKGILLAFGVAMVVALTSGSAFAGGDVKKGKAFFKKRCKTCHSLQAGKHLLGPSLAGVFGAKSGATDFSKYKGLKGSNYTWDEKTLNKFLANPKKFVGKSTMIFKAKKAKDRADVIAYLKSLK